MGNDNDGAHKIFCLPNESMFSCFLYQKLNGGRNGHFCDSIVVDIDCGSFMYVPGF